MRKIKLLIADDHQVFREGLYRLLQTEPDIDVVGQTGTGRETYELTIEQKPDVVLMDLEMPEGDGLETTQKIKESLPDTEIVVLTGVTDPKYLEQLAQHGITGFIYKHDALAMVIEAIRSASKGESMLSKAASRKILNGMSRTFEKKKRLRGLISSDLTKRELEILSLIAKGNTNAEIAQELYVSAKTVKNHVYNIYKKLGIKSRSHAIVKAIDLGLVTTDKI